MREVKRERACVGEREKGREGVCACVCVRERRREKDRERERHGGRK